MSESPNPAEHQPPRSQPETFRARSLSPSLTVNDIHESLAWYRDVLGFVVEEEWEDEGELRGCMLVAGDVTVLLMQDDFAKGRDRSKGVGLSLQFTTVQDVDERAALIGERGGALLSEPRDMPWGGRAFRVRDPDGFVLVISSLE